MPRPQGFACRVLFSELIEKGQSNFIFGVLCAHLPFRPSAGRPYSGGAAGAGEHPPAQAGATGGHSGTVKFKSGTLNAKICPTSCAIWN